MSSFIPFRYIVGLWAVVNNAGIVGTIFPVEWLTRDDYDRTLAVNLYGVVFVTQAFLPLIRREKGRIINMSSITARFSCVSAPYVISKFGVEAFSDTLRLEMTKLSTFLFKNSKSITSYEPPHGKTNKMTVRPATDPPSLTRPFAVRSPKLSSCGQRRP